MNKLYDDVEAVDLRWEDTHRGRFFIASDFVNDDLVDKVDEHMIAKQLQRGEVPVRLRFAQVQD